MRISEHILSVALFGFGLGLTTAHAFDTKSPANVFPPVGGGVPVAPQGAPSTGVGAGHPNAFQAFQTGAQALRAGDTKAALDALEYAARNGEVMALWKLGRMYADGDGVKQDDLRAFGYFRTLADSHADETPGTRPAVFVAKAFMAIGGYYLTGIPNSDVKPDAVHAREMFWYAASYFGDPDAQYRLGRMYLDGQGTAKDPKQARRWLFAAASKGQYEAQAVLGAMLFRGQSVPRDAAQGLKWLILARDAATAKETWITDVSTAAWKQATPDEQAVALVLVEKWIGQSRSAARTTP
jgi:TPR repeat protein